MEYALDKDIKIYNNKVYSKNNCMFVSAKENTQHAVIKRIKNRQERENGKQNASNC